MTPTSSTALGPEREAVADETAKKEACMCVCLIENKKEEEDRYEELKGAMSAFLREVKHN